MIITRRNNSDVCPRVIAICLCGEVCVPTAGIYLPLRLRFLVMLMGRFSISMVDFFTGREEFEVVEGPVGVVFVFVRWGVGALLLLILGSKS